MSTENQYFGTACHCAATLACGFLGVAWLAAAFYVGREVTQAEYRYIQAHGGKRADCPWYCGLFPSAWNLKSILDWSLPLLIAVAFALMTGGL